MSRKIWVRGAAGLLLGVFLIICYTVWGRANDRLTSILRVVQPTQTPQPTTTPSEPNAVLIEQRLNEIGEWKLADHRFSTDTKDPLILLRNDKQIVYIQDNQIRYEWLGGSGFQNNPLRFPSARTGYIWRNDKNAYIGLLAGTAGNRKLGDWYEINLTTFANNPLKRIGDLQLAPEGIQNVTFSTKPAGALFLEKAGDHYQEYWMNAQGKGQLYVNDYSAVREPFAPRAAAIIDTDRTGFSKVKEFGNLVVIEDERGLLLYQNGSLSPSVFRLSGYTLGQTQNITVDSSLRSQSPYTGMSALLLSLNSMEDGSVKGLLLPTNNPIPFSLSPRLMQEGWTLVNELNLVRIKDGQLQMVSYPNTQGIRSSEYHEADLSMAGITSITRQGTVMQGSKDGMKHYLSLNDVMNTRMETTVDSFWMSALPTGRMTKGEKVNTSRKEVNLSFPKLEALESENPQGPSIPEGLQNVLKFRDNSGSGDSTSNRTIRQVGNEWYVLTGDKLELWESATGLKELGNLPVKEHCSISNYVVCTTAADFTIKYGFWYVADTFNNRVLKLNDQKEIVGMASVPLPKKLFFSEKGELDVHGLQGITSFNQQLEQLSSKSAIPITVAKLPKEELVVYPEGFYEDPNGVRWAYHGSQLYVYDLIKQTVLIHAIGAMTNSTGTAKIIPYMNKIMLVLDDRIQLFDTKGNWQKEITFPRVQPDGIYVSTPKGENSYVMDREKGLFYLIQGFRLLRIDLNSGLVTPMLWQINANMGKLLLDRGKLYVTLQSGNGYDTPDAHEELVMIDAKSGFITRWKIVDGFTTDHITKDSELVLRGSSDSDGGITAGDSYMSYKLNEQGKPE